MFSLRSHSTSAAKIAVSQFTIWISFSTLGIKFILSIVFITFFLRFMEKDFWKKQLHKNVCWYTMLNLFPIQRLVLQYSHYNTSAVELKNALKSQAKNSNYSTPKRNLECTRMYGRPHVSCNNGLRKSTLLFVIPENRKKPETVWNSLLIVSKPHYRCTKNRACRQATFPWALTL